jgi:hypothetical protein
MKRTPSPPPEDSKRQGLEFFHHSELKLFFRVFSAGNEAGLYDALVYCRETSCEIPKWALDAAIIRQREFLFGGNERHAKWQKQFRQDMIDMARAEMVQECRERRAPWREAYVCASKMLSGNGAAGPHAMKDSYKKYKLTMKTNPYRYYIPRYIRLQERRTLIDPSGKIRLEGKAPALDPEHVKWLDKKFPFPKDGGPRRYRRS